MVAAEYGRRLCRTDAEIETTKILDMVGLSDKKDMFTRDLAAITLKRLELARTGLPTAAVAVTENQMTNVLAWEHRGFAVHSGRWDDPGLEKRIRTALGNLEDPKKRAGISASGRHLVPSDGGQRIVGRIERIAAGTLDD